MPPTHRPAGVFCSVRRIFVKSVNLCKSIALRIITPRGECVQCDRRTATYCDGAILLFTAIHQTPPISTNCCVHIILMDAGTQRGTLNGSLTRLLLSCSTFVNQLSARKMSETWRYYNKPGIPNNNNN